MQETVLKKIVQDKAVWLAERQRQQPLSSFQNEVKPSTRSFYHALQGARTVFILECKKASPSKGLIRNDFDPAAIAGSISTTLLRFRSSPTRNISREALISCPSSAPLLLSRCCAKIL